MLLIWVIACGDCYLCMLYFLCVISVSFSYHLPFILRLVLVWFSFGSRLVLDRFSIGSRSFFDRFSFILRSSSVHSPFGNRRSIEDWSKNERRIIGGKTEMYRNSNGKPRERRPEQELYFFYLILICYGKTYSWLYHFASSHSVYWKLMSYVKIRGGFGWRNDEVRIVFVVANLMLKLCKDTTFIFLAVCLCSSLADIGKNYQISRI